MMTEREESPLQSSTSRREGTGSKNRSDPPPPVTTTNASNSKKKAPLPLAGAVTVLLAAIIILLLAVVHVVVPIVQPWNKSLPGKESSNTIATTTLNSPLLSSSPSEPQGSSTISPHDDYYEHVVVVPRNNVNNNLPITLRPPPPRLAVPLRTKQRRWPKKKDNAATTMETKRRRRRRRLGRRKTGRRRSSSRRLVRRNQQQSATTRIGSFKVMQTFPHDADAFTQGLVIANRTLYEGTGRWGRSEVRIVKRRTGEVLKRRKLDDRYFGEGLAYYPDPRTGQGRLIQITWQSRTGFIYDGRSLEVLDEFTFSTTNDEGWGITYDPSAKEFIVTDGSDRLHFWDASTLREKRTPVAVTQRLPGEEEDSASPVRRLNEIEWDPATGTVLANVWHTDYIVRINPRTGFVTHRYDMTSLFTNRPASANVLNGIALTSRNKPRQFWVTGKLWPNMYRVQLIDGASQR